MQRSLSPWLAFLLAILSISICAQPAVTGTSSALAAAALPASAMVSSPLSVVAAENVYGDVLEQLGGRWIDLVNIISQPAQDPHLFEVSAATARRLAKAQLVVYNGAAYDRWIEHLLAASPNDSRRQIVIAKLMGKGPRDNPHLWYLPAAMSTLAQAVHTFLVQADPLHRSEYEARLTAFLASLAPINAKIAALRAKYQGLPIAATEPIFDYMVEAIGLQNHHTRLPLALMNGTEPSAAELAALTEDIAQRRIQLLIYNQQTAPPLAQHLLALAQRAGIAVLRISETLPAGLSYQTWMLAQLDELEQQLDRSIKAAPIPSPR